jgi:zinc protease
MMGARWRTAEPSPAGIRRGAAAQVRRAAAVAGVALALASQPAAAFDIQPVTSPSGVSAWLVEDHTLPLISLAYAFDGGTSQESLAQRGIANLLVSLLDEGAGDLDSQAFATRLEDLSISLSFDSDRDNVTGSLRTLTDNRDEAARLVRLALTEPRFDDEPFQRVRTSILTAIRSRDRNPNQQANLALNEALFPGHIYGVVQSGTRDTVEKITVDDLRAFQKKVLGRDNLKVVAVGDVDPPTLARMLDEMFGGLPAHAELVPVPDAPPPEIKRIDVAAATAQTSLRFLGQGLLREDPDYIPGHVAAFILGGGGVGSRLYDAVRVQRGLTYSISLGLDAANHAGWFSGSTSTRADQADEVLALIEAEIRKFAEDGPTEAELASAKAYLIGSYPLRFVTTSQVANQLLGVRLGDLGIDYVEKRNDLIAAVTIDDVRRVARRLFGNGMIVVRVGPPAS